MSESQVEALQVVNRVLSKQLQKSEKDVKKLRGIILMAAGALRVAGYHTSAENCMDAWKETEQ